jgi:hypothetical protein
MSVIIAGKATIIVSSPVHFSFHRLIIGVIILKMQTICVAQNSNNNEIGIAVFDTRSVFVLLRGTYLLEALKVGEYATLGFLSLFSLTHLHSRHCKSYLMKLMLTFFLLMLLRVATGQP